MATALCDNTETTRALTNRSSNDHQPKGWRTGTPGEHGCVLLVDQDRSIVDAIARHIWALGLDVVCAIGGREALAVAHRVQFRLLVLRLELPDISGLGIVGALRGTGSQAPFLAMTSSETMTVEAWKRGALRVFMEPLDLRELAAAVAGVVGLAPIGGAGQGVRGVSAGPVEDVTRSDLSRVPEPRTACERWCDFVTRLATSENDLKTNDRCARHLGVCGWVFAASCRSVGLTASNTRNFARAIRAIRLTGDAWQPDMILDIDDARTLKKFEERSGIMRGPNARPPSMDDFLERQQWIPRDNHAVRTFGRWVTRRRDEPRLRVP